MLNKWREGLKRKRRLYYLQDLRARRDRSLRVTNCGRLRKLLVNFPKVSRYELTSGGLRKCALYVWLEDGHEITSYDYDEETCIREAIRDAYLTLAGVKN